MHSEKLIPQSVVAKSPVYLAGADICQQLQAAGFDAFFVGGAVRDLILKPREVPKDIDIATSATPDEVSVLFPGSFFVGKSFGVSLVRSASKKFPTAAFSFEVATFRTEGAYSDSRHPDEVRFGSFADDSARRDFTMNALYFDPRCSLLLDPHDGLGDIRRHVIRAVGDPEVRFQEDALRIVRLFRFAAGCRMRVDESTLRAAKLGSGGLVRLSRERLVIEFVKVSKGKFASFLSLMLSNISPNLLGERLPPSFSAKSMDICFPHAVHKEIPLFSFLCGIVVGGDDRPSRFKESVLELKDWPAAKVEKRLFDAVAALRKVTDWNDVKSVAFVLHRFVLRLSDISVDAARLPFQIAALLTPEKSEFFVSFSEALGKVRPASLTLQEWWKGHVAVVDSSFRSDIVAQVKGDGLPDSFIAAWIGMNEGLAVLSALGLSNARLERKLDRKTAEKIEREKKEIQI